MSNDRETRYSPRLSINSKANFMEERMKKTLIASLLVLLSTMVLFSDAKLTFEATTVSFGKVEQGNTASLEFKFKNTGDSKLVITRVLPSCGCTAVKLEKKEYEAGESGLIPIKFNSHGYFGNITKAVTVHSNDNKNPTLRLLLKGEVMVKNFSLPEINQDKIDFNIVKLGKKYTKKLKIKNKGTIDMEIMDVFHNPEIVPEFSKQTIKPGEEADLIITFIPFKKNIPERRLRIRTNSVKSRYVIVKVIATVKDR